MTARETTSAKAPARRNDHQRGWTVFEIQRHADASCRKSPHLILKSSRIFGLFYSHNAVPRVNSAEREPAARNTELVTRDVILGEGWRRGRWWWRWRCWWGAGCLERTFVEYKRTSRLPEVPFVFYRRAGAAAHSGELASPAPCWLNVSSALASLQE